MNIKYISIGIVGLFLSASSVYAQKFDIRRLSTNEGLPAGQIGYVVQDQQGYIWMSSYYGMIRYDGIDIKTYTKENGLRNNLVYYLYLDDSDRLWVSHEEAGVGYMQGDSMYYPKELAPLDSLTVTYISQSADDRFWFSTDRNGVFIWDGNVFTHLTKKDGLPSNFTWYTRFDENGETWIGTQQGLAIYDGDSIRVVNETNGLSGAAAYSFAEEPDGRVWISTSSGITIYEDGNWEHVTSINDKPLGYIYDVFVDNTGLVWIATERYGIYWYDGERYTHIGKQNGLSSNYVYTFNEDNEGRVWVATDENGVNLFRNKNIRIYDTPDFVEGKSVNIILEQGEALWLGTEAGLTRFSEEGKSVHYQLPDSIASYKEIWDIDELPNGNLLVMNSNSRLYEFDGQQFRDFGSRNDIPWLFYHDALVDGETIWLAAESGLIKYQDGQVRTFTREDGLRDNFITSLYKDHLGEIWAVSELGINKILPDSVISYSFEDGITGSTMNLITQSPDNNYWIGTSVGFTRVIVDEMNKLIHIYNFSLAEEFLGEAQFLEFDQAGNLWLGTSGGIHFFSKKQLEEQEKDDVIHGVFMPLQDYGKGIEMNYLASTQDMDGNMWFGSFSHGLIKYNAGSTPTLSEGPRVFVKQLVINGEVFKEEAAKSLKLNHNQNNVSIEFGAFNYEYPERIYYEYRLRGFQDEWHTEYGKNKVDYTNLPPGDYEFQLRAKSIDSDWGNRVSLAFLKIAKPYWETSWFYLLIGMSIILLIAAIIKIMLVYFEKQKLSLLVDRRTAELMKALGEKDVLIKEIHHRVKNNLSVVSSLLDLQSWQIQDKKAKMAIENSKLRIQTMSAIHEKLYLSDDLSNIEFAKFARELIEQISKSLSAEGKDIDVTMDIEPVQLNIHAAIPCGLILNEAVSNSFEHAFQDRKKGHINISFKEAGNDVYELKVKDNGEGISEKILHGERSSLGVTLIYSLAGQVKGAAQILNENGTVVKVTIPKNIV